MTWKEKMQEWGGGEVSFLTEDGEVITFVVVGEPVLIKGKYRGQDTERIGCPVWTGDGFTLLVCGKRIARRLSKYEGHFKEWAFDVIRHGEQGDTKTRYEVCRCSDSELEKDLLKVAKAGVKPQELIEAVEAANEIALG